MVALKEAMPDSHECDRPCRGSDGIPDSAFDYTATGALIAACGW